MFVFLGVLCAAGSAIVAVLLPAYFPDVGKAAPRTSVRHDLPGDQTIYVYRVPRPGYLLVSVSGPMETFVADILDKDRSQHIPVVTQDPRPGWMRRSVIEDPQTSRGIAAGWPMLCFWCLSDRNVNHDPQEVGTGIVELTVKKAVRTFPARPIWLGLLVNTAFYAAIFLVLWFTLVFGWRRVRSWRGRCPNCAYPKQEGVDRCPECGMPLQPTVAGSS